MRALGDGQVEVAFHAGEVLLRAGEPVPTKLVRLANTDLLQCAFLERGRSSTSTRVKSAKVLPGEQIGTKPAKVGLHSAPGAI